MASLNRAAALLVPLLAALELLAPGRVQALGLHFYPQTGSDTLRVCFEGGVLPEYTLQRVALDRLRLTFPEEGRRPLPPVELAGASLVSEVTRTADGLDIFLQTSAFDFVDLPMPGRPELYLLIFRDPAGKQCRSRAPRPSAGLAMISPGEKNGPGAMRQIFFNSPYAVRAKVIHSVVPLTVEPSRPGSQDAATGEARYKAVQDGPAVIAGALLAVPSPAAGPGKGEQQSPGGELVLLRIPEQLSIGGPGASGRGLPRPFFSTLPGPQDSEMALLLLVGNGGDVERMKDCLLEDDAFLRGALWPAGPQRGPGVRWLPIPGGAWNGALPVPVRSPGQAGAGRQR